MTFPDSTNSPPKPSDDTNSAPPPILDLDGPHTDPDQPLVVAPCGLHAARHAVLSWHYSEAMPAGKIARFGVWEHGAFMGVIVFGRGGNHRLGRPYGLDQTECVELVRVALRPHTQPVTRMIAAALRQLRDACPGLALVVSYADTAQGHHGGIYQAGNWIYTGHTDPNVEFYIVHNKLTHGRTLRSMAAARPQGTSAFAWVRDHVDPHARKTTVPVKHRYLYPLDKPTRRRVRSLHRPYPTRPL